MPEQEGSEFGMMYQLQNMEKNLRIRVKIWMSKDDLHVPTATGIWPSANWMERQEYDFFGFKFVGHPDLRRILNMDEMNYFPMRKEYPLEDGSRDDKNDKMFGR
jgi:NADH-quinone oxidoreductase subunit C